MKNRTFNSDRNIATRDIKKEHITQDANLKSIEENFNKNMNRIDEKFKIIKELKSKNFTEAANDILRSQIVLIMSSMDFYIHEIVKYGIIKIFIGERAGTKKYNEVLISLDCVKRALGNLEAVDWLEEEITLQHTRKTYMSSKNIEKALFLISDKNFLDLSIKKISETTKKDKKNILAKLAEIYQRRNQIAHESDRNPQTGKINDISEELVKEYFNIIKMLIEEIHKNVIQDI